jgi:prefoldin subunit 5
MLLPVLPNVEENREPPELIVRSTRDDLQSMRSWVSRALQVEKNKHASESRTLIKRVNHDLKKMFDTMRPTFEMLTSQLSSLQSEIERLQAELTEVRTKHRALKKYVKKRMPEITDGAMARAEANRQNDAPFLQTADSFAPSTEEEVAQLREQVKALSAEVTRYRTQPPTLPALNTGGQVGRANMALVLGAKVLLSALRSVHEALRGAGTAQDRIDIALRALAPVPSNSAVLAVINYLKLQNLSD